MSPAAVVAERGLSGRGVLEVGITLVAFVAPKRVQIWADRKGPGVFDRGSPVKLNVHELQGACLEARLLVERETNDGAVEVDVAGRRVQLIATHRAPFHLDPVCQLEHREGARLGRGANARAARPAIQGRSAALLNIWWLYPTTSTRAKRTDRQTGS